VAALLLLWPAVAQALSNMQDLRSALQQGDALGSLEDLQKLVIDIRLLVQHIALTLAALSIVRERRGGSIELFRAAALDG
jgi:hypothetical protein